MKDDKVSYLAFLGTVVTLCGSKDALKFTEFLYNKKEFTYQDIQKVVDVPTESLNKMVNEFMKSLIIEPADLKYTSLEESTSYYAKVLKSDSKMPVTDWYRTTLFFEGPIKKSFPTINDLKIVYERAISLSEAGKGKPGN